MCVEHTEVEDSKNVRWTLCLSNLNACPQDQHWAQVERVARQHLGDGVHASPKILRSHGTSAQSHAVALSYTPIFVLEHLPRDAEAQPVVTEQHQCGEQCNHRRWGTEELLELGARRTPRRWTQFGRVGRRDKGRLSA